MKLVYVNGIHCSCYIIHRNMWHAWMRTERHLGVWWGNPNERDHLLYLGADRSILLK